MQKNKLLTLCFLCQDNKVLLGMKKRGFGAGRWNGFGGKLEQGETIEQAAKREFQEEAGIDVSGLVEHGVLEFYFEGNDEILEVHVFKADEYTGTPVETDEMKPLWYDYNDVPYDEMWEGDKFWLPFLLKDENFSGTFSFDSDENLLRHEVSALP